MFVSYLTWRRRLNVLINKGSSLDPHRLHALPSANVCLWHKADMLNAPRMSASGGSAATRRKETAPGVGDVSVKRRRTKRSSVA